MNLLLTGAFTHDEKDALPFLKLGFERVFMMPDERGEMDFDPQKVDAIICNGLFLYRDISLFTRLKYVQLTSAGFDRVPLDEIRRRGIELKNARGVYSASMAEYAVGGVLQLYKSFPFFDGSRREKRWEKKRDLRELSGETVCVVGAGSVGYEVAQRFKAFETEVVGIDEYLEPRGAFDTILPLSELDRTLTRSDIVVLTLPLTEKTYGLFGENRFAQTKTGATFINIARGALVDEVALFNALKSKKLSGAVLDVFTEEPLPTTSPLWDAPNVVITPHISFVSPQNSKRLFMLSLTNLKNWLLI
ncbi:MAG: NAD(P)-dependent oxidoreductase [Thermoguttaceae bacterium]|jgi:phosphoglycerate dehydrogenase-like enzyme|nr:NAD(P)-dependent oxidoreductase [Thermoguttaceae bacterium]